MPGASSAETSIPLLGRLQAHWQLKAVATLGVSVVFWSGYLYLSRHAFFPVSHLPLTALDRWAGYRPYPWSWIYESVFVLTGIIPWLIITKTQLRRYVTGFALLSLLSFALFILFPVAAPRPTNVEPTPFLLFITHIDGPLNAFPSLHAGCLIYNLLLAHRLFRKSMTSFIAGALWLWVLLILFGTLATKQHYALDLLAGGALGWLADWVAWRSSIDNESAAENARRNNADTSQTGCR
jgi:membrane-associated phospholipid phosphatase